MRFHVVSLPHTNTTADFPSCAFTQKVVRFCHMMKVIGHEVFLYAGEQNDAPCDDRVVCISEADRASMVGDGHYTSVSWGHPAWESFNSAAIAAMRDRIQERDFICLIGGHSHKPIADAFPAHISVEFGIGYAGTFAKYRVFESYAWMHMVYGAEAGSAERKDGHWFDAVIPNQVNPTQQRNVKRPRDHFLYVGRLTDRKGYRIAQEVCEHLGKKLILAGPGDDRGTGYGEFVGEVDMARRDDLMAGAVALFAPTRYIEPFGTVTIEAMAWGTPVICTDWGAFTETVEPGIDGFRCRTFAEFLVAARCAGALDRSAISKRAIARFSMATVSRQYDAYFHRLSTLWDGGWYQT